MCTYLQRLHGGQVPAVVVGAEHDVLLGDPGDGLVRVAVEALDLVRAEQALLPHERHLPEALPCLVQFLTKHKVFPSIPVKHRDTKTPAAVEEFIRHLADTSACVHAPPRHRAMRLFT